MSAVAWAVALVAAQRLAELAWSARNTRRLLAAGAVEHGPGHYWLIVALHMSWLAAMLLLVPAQSPVWWPAALLFLVLQPVRLWIICSLGGRWTTRVLVVPGAPRVRRGPYRWMPHPNYAVVALEIVLLPLAFRAWGLATLFGMANALLLWHRIRIEDRALKAAEAGNANFYGESGPFRSESPHS